MPSAAQHFRKAIFLFLLLFPIASASSSFAMTEHGNRFVLAADDEHDDDDDSDGDSTEGLEEWCHFNDAPICAPFRNKPAAPNATTPNVPAPAVREPTAPTVRPPTVTEPKAPAARPPATREPTPPTVRPPATTDPAAPTVRPPAVNMPNVR
jgi:hypothetical protein